jgi:hypothetical protein
MAYATILRPSMLTPRSTALVCNVIGCKGGEGSPVPHRRLGRTSMDAMQTLCVDAPLVSKPYSVADLSESYWPPRRRRRRVIVR